MTALCSGKICTIFPEKGALNLWKACTIALEYSTVSNRFRVEKLASKLASGIGIKNRDETGEKTERIREFGALISLKYFSENTTE